VWGGTPALGERLPAGVVAGGVKTMWRRDLSRSRGEREPAVDGGTGQEDPVAHIVADRLDDILHREVDHGVGIGHGVDADTGGEDRSVGREEVGESGIRLGRRAQEDEELDEGLRSATYLVNGREDFVPVDRGRGFRVGAV